MTDGYEAIYRERIAAGEGSAPTVVREGHGRSAEAAAANS
jgi:hypothetical protein